ncbi:MAG: hypothetical protein HY207_10440 [Nitrospirae bacterium]|nr:hypothetical protein [Nitrospirota bacterium]
MPWLLVGSAGTIALGIGILLMPHETSPPSAEPVHSDPLKQQPTANLPAQPLPSTPSLSAREEVDHPQIEQRSDLTDLLERGREAVIQGKFQEAVSFFAAAHAIDTTNSEIKIALASSYRSLGWEQLEAGRYEDAAVTFQRGIRFVADDPVTQTGLGYAYYQLRRDDDAFPPLLRATKMEPPDPRAYQLLGELYDRHNDLPRAADYLQKALVLAPGDVTLTTKLQKLQRDHRQQETFVRAVTRHFTIQFDGNENRDLYRTVIEILEDAYREIGRAFSYYPDETITVILYTAQQFQDVTRLPGWAGASYDGKIRVPSAGYERQPDVLRKLLSHEYVHAVIHAVTRQQIAAVKDMPSPRVPVWLHEGLAQYLEAGSERETVDGQLRAVARSRGMIPLSVLESSFMRFNANQASLAYAESLSVVGYLVNRYGLYRMTRLLEALSKLQTVDGACQDAFAASYEAIEKSWQATLVES